MSHQAQWSEARFQKEKIQQCPYRDELIERVELLADETFLLEVRTDDVPRVLLLDLLLLCPDETTIASCPKKIAVWRVICRVRSASSVTHRRAGLFRALARSLSRSGLVVCGLPSIASTVFDAKVPIKHLGASAAGAALGFPIRVLFTR